MDKRIMNTGIFIAALAAMLTLCRQTPAQVAKAAPAVNVVAAAPTCEKDSCVSTAGMRHPVLGNVFLHLEEAPLRHSIVSRIEERPFLRHIGEAVRNRPHLLGHRCK